MSQEPDLYGIVIAINTLTGKNICKLLYRLRDTS